MIKKWFLHLGIVLLVMGILTGCGTNNEPDKSGTNANQNQEVVEDNSNQAVQEKSVSITISKNEGKEIIVKKQIEIEKNVTLMEVMKANFEIEEDGGFIHAIDGIAPDKEGVAWMFFVNDEMPKVGAVDFKLSPGDKVVFDLQAW